MLTHIINPSLKVDDQFAMWVVMTDAERVHSELLLSQSGSDVVLKTAQRKTVRILRPEIDEMHKSQNSLIPEAILADLRAQEAADLIAWLGSL